MSDIAFPASLPSPLASGYGVAPKSRTISMATDAGFDRIRASKRSAPVTHTFTWKFTAAQYAVFDAFYENDLAAGTKPFVCPLDDGKGGIEPILVNFVDVPTEVCEDGMNWRVSVRVLTAGAPFGKFPRLIRVDGAIGGEDPGGSGTGAQNPLREIHLENYTMTMAGNGVAHVIIGNNGKLALVDGTGQRLPAGMWKAATNTTPSSRYSYSSTLTTLDYRDYGSTGPNNPDVYSQPPVTYNANPVQNQQLSVEWKDPDVNSITGDRRVSVKASVAHPWIKYLLTVRVKDMDDGYTAVALITITVGTMPPGRVQS